MGLRMPRARPPMRRGLKLVSGWTMSTLGVLPRARPPMRRGLKLKTTEAARYNQTAARAAPYEKGTETRLMDRIGSRAAEGRARGPL